MKSDYKNYDSFSGKTRILLSLIGIIPFLLVIYLFVLERINITETALLFSCLALFCILTGFSLMRRSADQLGFLAKQTALVETGQKTDPVEINGDQEMNDIAKHFNTILDKLHDGNREIKEQSVQLMRYARDLTLSTEKAKKEEELRNRLSRYVGKNLVEKLVSNRDGLLLENERKEVTILFADIRSFSTIAERMAAEEVVSMLNHFFGNMVDIIFNHNGILDKFVGDQIMAVFGLIDDEQEAGRNAVRAAIEMQEALKDLMIERARSGLETFEIGIGINTGKAIVGNIGSENRMDYTVIGDCVNVAARLQQIAKGGEIIIGEKSFLQAHEFFPMKKRCEIFVKNKSEQVVCYKVLK